MAQTARRAAAAPPRRRPAPVIRASSVMEAKRRLGLLTIWIPTLGTLVAIATTFVWGIGALEIGLLLAMYLVTMAGVEVGFHRQLAHRAFRTPPWLRSLLAIAGSMAAQGRASYWAATHRRHHVYSDKPEDPHSPYWRITEHGEERMGRLRGLWHAHLGNMVTGYPTNVTLFARDLVTDPAIARIDRLYLPLVALGLLIPTALGAAIAGSWIGAVQGLLWGGFVRIFVVHHVYFANGSFSHMYGGRPYDNGDGSTNNPIFAVPTFGSAYQNNHHAFPTSALLGLRWYQPDVGMWFIRGFERLGLAWDVRRVPREQLESRRREEPRHV
jgi:stearoyl-CoA desaturase (delta-9 desaturase)